MFYKTHFRGIAIVLEGEGSRQEGILVPILVSNTLL